VIHPAREIVQAAARRSADPGLDLRCVGGSDAGAVLGVSPWASSFDVWMRTVFGPPSGESPSAPLVWGHRLEALVLAAYEAETGDELTVPDSYVEPPLRATPDAWGGSNGRTLIEVKTTRSARWDEVPPHYVAQVLFVGGLLGAEAARVVALHGGSDLAIYDVPLDGAEDVVAAVRAFALEHVVPAQEALAAGGDPWQFRPLSTRRDASPKRRRTPARAATEAEAARLEVLAAASAAKDAADDAHASARMALLEAVEGVAVIEHEGLRASISEVERKSTAWSKVVADLTGLLTPAQQAALAAIVEARTDASLSRQLRLTRED
jgi:hypothetical protein